MAALVSTLLALAISAQTPALRPVTLDRRIVTPKLPTWTALERPATSDAIVIDGRPVASTRGTTWAELLPDAQVGEDGSIVWPTQVVVIDRVDLLSLRGMWRQWRTDFFTEDLRALEQETALFVNMVRIVTKGQVKIAPTWTIEEDVFFGGESDVVGREMLDAYLKPLLPNGHRSVLLVHPAMVEREVLGAVGGTPYASLSYYKHADAARPGQMARAMFNAWVATLPYHLRDAGWDVPDSVAWPLPAPIAKGSPLPLSQVNAIVPKGAFGVLAGNRASGFENRLPAPSSTLAQPWDAVQDDLWSRLPRETSKSSGTYVPLALGEWMAKASGAKPAAIAEFEGQTLIRFDQPMAGFTTSLGVSLLSDDVRTATKLAFAPGQAEGLPASGYMEAKTVGDNDRGSVAEIRELSLRRKGWMRMLGPVDPAKTPVLEFWLKPRATVWPTDVWFDTGDGTGYSVRMFGATPAEIDRGQLPNVLDIRPEPVWQRVVVEFGKAVSKPVLAVYLRVPPGAEADLMPRDAPPALLMDDFEVRESASATVTPIAPVKMTVIPALDSTLPDDRARFIANASTDQAAAIAKLLADPYDQVKLNALAFFRANKLVPPVETITPLATHFNSRISMLATELLAKNGTPPAIEALRRATQFGLSDFTKGMAAEAMPKIDERKVLGEMTVLLHLKSPWARTAAVRALSRQEFREADLVMLSYLNDTDPRVRYEVIRSLRLEQDAVLNRMQEVARLDLSESVRALANARLLGSKVGDRVAPVAALEPSAWVRAESVRLAGASAGQRAFAVTLAADADPLVASAALDALRTTMSGEAIPTLKVTSRDPRVLLAWLRFAESAKQPVPADVLDAAQSSRLVELAALAKKLKGGS